MMKILIICQLRTLTLIKLMKSSERWHKKHLTDLNLESHLKLQKTIWLWSRKSLGLLIFQSIFKKSQPDLLKSGFQLMIRMNSQRESISQSERFIPLFLIKRLQIRLTVTFSREEELMLLQELIRWSWMQSKYLEQIQCTTIVI